MTIQIFLASLGVCAIISPGSDEDMNGHEDFMLHTAWIHSSLSRNFNYQQVFNENRRSIFPTGIDFEDIGISQQEVMTSLIWQAEFCRGYVLFSSTSNTTDRCPIFRQEVEITIDILISRVQLMLRVRELVRLQTRREIFDPHQVRIEIGEQRVRFLLENVAFINSE